MANYQVVCVDTAPAGTHRHITTLGLRTTVGIQTVSKDWVIGQLRDPSGHRFYTVSPSTGKTAWVIEGGCEVCSLRPYVRTTADGIRDNNLLSLGACPVA
jgi:hypothetical protein